MLLRRQLNSCDNSTHSQTQNSAEDLLCHTLVLYQNEESQHHDFFTIAEPEHSSYMRLIPKFEKFYAKWGRFMRFGWVQIGNFGDFRPISLSHHISVMVQDRTKVAIDHNRKSHMRFKLVPKSMTLDDPELIFNGHYALCYITHTCLPEPTTKIWMKIDPYYQQQKCSSGIDVSSNIRCMRIFAEVCWTGGFKWE